MGQGGVGKTAMTLRYSTGQFNEQVSSANCSALASGTSLALSVQYLPTIGDMHTKDVEVNGHPRHIQIDDTAGQVRAAPTAFWQLLCSTLICLADQTEYSDVYRKPTRTCAAKNWERAMYVMLVYGFL
jgi:GTPase SAR1 family protein